jgi:hypothetical protein
MRSTPQGDDGAATTWDLRNGLPVGDPIEVDKGLLHVAIEPRQEIVALGMNNGVVFVGSFRNNGEVLPPLSHPSSVTALALQRGWEVDRRRRRRRLHLPLES